MIEISDFDSFLQAAREQPESQRLLFVLVKTVLPEDADATETARFEAGQGGGLLPVMYVDKDPEGVNGFQALVEESRQMGEDWNILLAGALTGRNGQPPSQEDVDEAFSSIIKQIHAGGDLSGLLAFHRDGTPLHFESGP